MILYELITGVVLFERDTRSHNIVKESLKARLCMWADPSAKLLDKVCYSLWAAHMCCKTSTLKIKTHMFLVRTKVSKSSIVGEPELLRRARHLIHWTLQAHPRGRPNFDQILRHPLFSTGDATGYTLLKPGLVSRTNVFISYYQKEVWVVCATWFGVSRCECDGVTPVYTPLFFLRASRLFIAGFWGRC